MNYLMLENIFFYIYFLICINALLFAYLSCINILLKIFRLINDFLEYINVCNIFKVLL